MRRVLKRNYKMVLGIIIGILISGVVVYATTTISSSNVSYNNSSSGLKSTNVKSAIDEIYQKIKPCKVVSGTGKNIGDEIQCGTEHFYIINYSDTNTKMFTKYYIEDGMWIMSSNPNSPIFISNPSNIQNEECSSGTFKGVSATYSCFNGRSGISDIYHRYNSYLSLFGLPTSISVKLITIRELNALGCNGSVMDNGYPAGDCKSSSYSFLKEGQYWVDGSNGDCFYYVSSGTISCTSTSQTRLVITIPNSYIKI